MPMQKKERQGWTTKEGGWMEVLEEGREKRMYDGQAGRKQNMEKERK